MEFLMKAFCDKIPVILKIGLFVIFVMKQCALFYQLMLVYVKLTLLMFFSAFQILDPLFQSLRL